MTPTEKLLKKEFKIASEEDLFKLIDKKEDSFFNNNFFTEKENYLQMINALIKSINTTGESYSEYMEMVKSGSILHSSWASVGFGKIQKENKENRKQLKNHIRFFL